MRKLWIKIKRLSYDSVIKLDLILIFFAVFAIIVINQLTIIYNTNGFVNILDADLQVYYLDVGQASSVFIVFPSNQTMLIDTGSEDSQDDLLTDLDWIMTQNNLSNIDFLVLTHSDSDHVGGASAVLEKYQVYNVYRPIILSKSEADSNSTYQVVYTDIYDQVIQAIYEEPNCNVDFIDSNKYFTSKMGIGMTFYAGEKEYYSETNAYSPYIVISYANRTFLFTGDATSTREDEFMEYLESAGITLEVDFFMVAHHGSRYSNTEDFLATISPKYAFVSAGDSTHPAQQVLKRLENVGVLATYVTKNDGTIGVGVFENGDFLIVTSTSALDLPVIVVALCLLIFVTVKIWDYNLDIREVYLENYYKKKHKKRT